MRDSETMVTIKKTRRDIERDLDKDLKSIRNRNIFFVIILLWMTGIDVYNVIDSLHYTLHFTYTTEILSNYIIGIVGCIVQSAILGFIIATYIYLKKENKYTKKELKNYELFGKIIQAQHEELEKLSQQTSRDVTNDNTSAPTA